MTGLAATRRTLARLFGISLSLFPFAVAAGGIWLIWTQIGGYGASLVKNRDWVRQVEVPTLSELNEAVFERLVANGMIRVERRPGLVLLHHSPCTNLTRSAPEKVETGGTASKEELRQLFDLLCLSPQGAFIQDEIEAWNLSYELLAIRDNRNFLQPPVKRKPRDKKDTAAAPPSVRPCDDKESKVSARFFVPPHCYGNLWSISYVPGNAPEVQAESSPNAEPPARDYAFLAMERIAYPGDWRVVAPFGGARTRGEAAGAAGHYKLTSEVTLGPSPISVQVVGSVTRIRIASGALSEEWEVDAAGNAKPFGAARAGAFSIDVDLVCDSTADHQDHRDCDPDLDKRGPFAFDIALNTRGQQSTQAKLEIWAIPSLAPAAEFASIRAAAATIDELKKGRSGKRKKIINIANLNSILNRNVDLARSTNIRANCAAPHPTGMDGAITHAAANGRCTLTWETSKSAEKREVTKATIFLAKGDTPLVEPSGILTDAAFEQNLAEIIGLGPTTYGSLARSLLRSADQDVRLTIDHAYQNLAVGSLRNNIACDSKNRIRKRDLSKSCEDASRGTLVVMDAQAGPKGGQILAVASWPGMDPGIGAWDLGALDAGRPSESPIAGNAWRAHDISAMAGSTFKVVTALAAMQQVLDKDDERLRDILLGTSPIARTESALRIERGAVEGKCDPKPPVPPGSGNVLAPRNDNGAVGKCLSNSHNEPLVPGPVISRFCRRDQPNRIGLCEAMATSSNLYFGGMALYLDAPAFEHARMRGALPNLALASMARRLFPDGLGRQAKADACQRIGQAETSRNYPLFRLWEPAPSRLGASPFILPSEAARTERNIDTRQLELAQNGFGQAVTATPVGIATVYASIGAQTLLRPTLVSLPEKHAQLCWDGAEGEPLLSVPSGRRGEYERMMIELKRGLNGVIMEGTAKAYRESLPKELLNNMFLKTGTAILSEKPKVYSSWLAGWVEPPQSDQRQAGRSSGIDRRIAIACQISRTKLFGADACGRIVAAFISNLHASRR